MRFLSFILALMVLSAGIVGVEEVTEKEVMKPVQFKLKFKLMVRYKKAMVQYKQHIKDTKDKYLKMMRGNWFTHSVKVGESVSIKGRMWFKQWQSVKKNKKVIIPIVVSVLMLTLAYTVHPLFSMGVCGAVIPSTATGN